MYLISFFIATNTNSFSGPSTDILGMPACLYVAYPPCNEFKVFLCFCPKIHFNTNHWGHGSLADINWPFCPGPILTHSPSSLFIRKSHTVSIYDAKRWDIESFYVFITKNIQLKYKLSLPLMFTFFYQILILGTQQSIVNGNTTQQN